jgi:DNA-binding CsgD family transcriptional regulator
VARLPAISLSDLTEAQRRLALDLCYGYTLEEVATRRRRSSSTLKNHLKMIYRKFGIVRQHQLVAALLLTNGLRIVPVWERPSGGHERA